MSSDLKKASRDLLEGFIRAYESQSCLWRIKYKDYHDMGKRDAAYDILLKIYRLIDPNANKEAVVKKINTFRINYIREKKLKNGVFWDVTPCGSCKNRRFGGT
jgi:hypothetical protein